jgi:transposase InsO family protein
MAALTASKPADLQIPKLTANNYKTWSELTTEALKGRAVWEYTQGEVERPEEKDQLQIWVQNNAIASGIIKGGLTDGQLGHVIGIESAKDVWDKLKTIHQSDGTARVRSLLGEFMRYRLVTTIDDTASALTRIQNEIGNLKLTSKPSEDMKIEALLASLGPEYEFIVAGIDVSDTTKFEDVVAKLRKAETRLKGQNQGQAQNLARFTSTATAGKKDKKKGSCFHCGKEGHYKRECRKFLAEQAKTKENDTGTQGSRTEGGQDKGRHSHSASPANHRPEQSRDEPRAWAVSNQTQKVTAGTEGTRTDPWYLDSAATSHMTNCRDVYTSIRQIKDTVTVADGGQLLSQGLGRVQVRFEENACIDDVLYVPGLQANLLSIGQLAERGITCLFSSQGAYLRRDGDMLAYARRVGRNYVLYPQGAHEALMTAGQDNSQASGQDEGQDSGEDRGRDAGQHDTSQEKEPDAYTLWHRRLGHAGEEKMKLFQTNVEGIPALVPGQRRTCETCALTKSAKTINRDASEHTERPLQRVYTDFWGPFGVPTPSGARYMLTFTDDYSRRSWIYLTRTRTELYERFREWQMTAERQSNEKLQAIRCDNAGEYQALATRLRRENGVVFEFTTPYTPEQNGVAERLNRTLITKVRAMLAEADLPQWLWGEAAYAACYLHNRTPRRYDGGWVTTPKEMWTGEIPDLSHLRVFGCVAYAQLAKEQRNNKLDQTSIRGIFVGYTPTARQYRVYNPETGVVGRYSTVRFDEKRKGGTLLAPTESTPPWTEVGDTQHTQDQDSTLPDGDTIVVRAPSPGPREDRGRRTPSPSPPQSRAPSPPAPPERPQDAGEANAGRPRRIGIRLPERYREEQAQQAIAKYDQEISTPTSYDEAISGPQKRQWETAINEELQSLASNDVWQLVDAPKGANIVSCKWVFKIKRLPNGQIDRYKARLVARGFSQRYGIDYDETFAPVVRMESLRILLAIAAVEDMEVHQMDVVTAYLAGELEEEIYMAPPQGLPGTEDKVCHVRKGLYGLKQSGRVWNKRITKELKRAGLRAISEDKSIWVDEKRNLILALYVDDIILFARETQEIQRIKEFLTERFHMKDLGPIHTVLGMRVRRNRAERTLWLDQTHYIKDTLKEFQHENCRPVSTPADGYEHLQAATAQDAPFADVAMYQRALGQLNWLVRGTRPDLAFVVHKLSQHCHQPYEGHWTGVKRVFRYLNHSQRLGIRYGPEGGNLVGYSDSDYAADDRDRRSTMGYVYILNGAAVTWAARKQHSISTSTTEAEYVGLCNAAKEAVWIRNLLRSIGRSGCTGGARAVRILGDNQSALRLVANPEFHSRSKHIDVQYHYTRELVEDGVVSVEYVPTAEMAADCLTKPLKRTQFEVNVATMGLVEE